MIIGPQFMIIGSQYMISGFRQAVDDICTALGFYAEQTETSARKYRCNIAEESTLLRLEHILGHSHRF
jgi:hypothetical protein